MPVGVSETDNETARTATSTSIPARTRAPMAPVPHRAVIPRASVPTLGRMAGHRGRGNPATPTPTRYPGRRMTACRATGPATAGSMWRSTIHDGGAPRARCASMCVDARASSTNAAACDARAGHDTRPTATDAPIVPLVCWRRTVRSAVPAPPPGCRSARPPCPLVSQQWDVEPQLGGAPVDAFLFLDQQNLATAWRTRCLAGLRPPPGLRRLCRELPEPCANTTIALASLGTTRSPSAPREPRR